MEIAIPRELDGHLDQVRRARLSALGPWTYYDHELLGSADDPTPLKEVRAVVLPWTGEVSTDVLLRLPSLELVASLGTGVWDEVNVPALSRRAVRVANVRDYASGAVAEHTLGLLLAVLRNIPAADQAIREGRWESGRVRAQELSGMTLGIVGLGAIGSRVATLTSCLGMRVLSWTPHPERYPRLIPVVSDLPTLLRSADVVSLHAAWQGGSPLLGADEFALMRPGAVLINTARGHLVDEDALADALASGRLSGAGLDVFAREPLPPESPLLRFPRVVLSPHHAANTNGAMWRAVDEALDNLEGFFKGQPRNIVNPEVVGSLPTVPPIQKVSAG